MDAYMKTWATLVEDLINSYDTYLEEPEHLLTPTHLEQFLTQRGIMAQKLDADDLQQVRELRSQVRTLWESPTESELTTALNAHLKSMAVTLQLVQADAGSQWRFQPAKHGNWYEQLVFGVYMGLGALVEAHGLDRLRVCGAEPCRDVFVDTSRNRSKRYCSERCANRHNIAAFRERQRPD